MSLGLELQDDINKEDTLALDYGQLDFDVLNGGEGQISISVLTSVRICSARSASGAATKT